MSPMQNELVEDGENDDPNRSHVESTGIECKTETRVETVAETKAKRPGKKPGPES